jgi:hypothetical protein
MATLPLASPSREEHRAGEPDGHQGVPGARCGVQVEQPDHAGLTSGATLSDQEHVASDESAQQHDTGRERVQHARQDHEGLAEGS